jgi:hypothetical protein
MNIITMLRWPYHNGVVHKKAVGERDSIRAVNIFNP